MRDMKPSEVLAYLGSIVGIITVAQSMLRTLLPPPLQDLLRRLFDRLKEHFTRYHYVDIPENDESCLANELYGAIKLHLSANAKSYSQKAKRVKLCRTSSSAELTWSPARREQVPMKFEGARVWWEHHVTPRQTSESRRWQPRDDDEEERRKYTLRVHKRDKERIVAPYMEHILKQAQDIKHNNRQRHLFTNGKGGGYLDSIYRSTWDFVPFKHPSTFKTLAMDPETKAQIQADLQAFACGQDFYRKTGRAWKRGYLLHGPPGTGKSSLIGAMANFLRYDVYDLELTQVRSNGDLRKMLLRTTSKSIIVIEDIDCSLDLANSRGKKLASSSSSSSTRKRESKSEEKDDTGSSAMTLSGLLNFTDGLWSCCGEERIFVFTTNHVENLDPALLRPGRMDMHILMSYCMFPALKILAMNYLEMDEHHLFPKVKEIIDDAHVTPAEVSEVFMRNREEPEKAMEELVIALEVAKARPWPPIPVKKAGVEDEVPDDVEEVKKAVDVTEEVKSPSVQKERCPFCPCSKKEKSSSRRRTADSKYEKKVDKEEEDDICIDKDEVPQIIKKVEKAD